MNKHAAILEQNLLRELDSQKDWISSTILRLMAVDSTPGNEQDAQEIVLGLLNECGVQGERQYLDTEFLETSAFSSPLQKDSHRKFNVVADCGGSSILGKNLILSGHIDVLTPPALPIWGRDPFRPEYDRASGIVRGWGGLKAGMAAMLAVLRALNHAKVEPVARLRFQSVVEEELGGNGAINTLRHSADFSAAIVAGAAGGAVHRTSVGVCWVRVEVTVNAHQWIKTSVNFVDAVGTLIGAARAFVEKREENAPEAFRSLTSPLGFNLGAANFQGYPSMRLGEASFDCRIAFFPHENQEQVLDGLSHDLSHAASEIFGEVDHEIQLSAVDFTAQGYELDEERFVDVAVGSLQSIGSFRGIKPSTTVTDVRSFVHAGIPAVLVGPEVGRLHGVEETVSVVDTLQSARAIALVVSRWCNLQEISPV